MVTSLPEELKGKLTLALLKEQQEKQGAAGDGQITLHHACGGQPAQVHIGSKPSKPSPLSHNDAITMGTNAHLTGGQLRSVMEDIISI